MILKINLNVIILTLGLILKRCSLKPTLGALLISFLFRKTLYSQIALEWQNNTVKPLFSGHPVLSGRIFQFFFQTFLAIFSEKQFSGHFYSANTSKDPAGILLRSFSLWDSCVKWTTLDKLNQSIYVSFYFFRETLLKESGWVMFLRYLFFLLFWTRVVSVVSRFQQNAKSSDICRKKNTEITTY